MADIRIILATCSPALGRRRLPGIIDLGPKRSIDHCAMGSLPIDPVLQ
jgi:hypothetical protein